MLAVDRLGGSRADRRPGRSVPCPALRAGCRGLSPARRLGPRRDVGPVPDGTDSQREHRGGKADLTATPVAHDARARQAETLGDLGGIDQVVDVDGLVHDRDSTWRTVAKPLATSTSQALRSGLVVHSLALCTFEHPADAVGAHAEAHMTDDPTLPDPDELPGQLDAAGRLADRWARLDPGEQALVSLAIAEMHAGTFASRASWERFVDAALDLFPSLLDGTVTAAELHEIAMRDALDDQAGD